MNDNGNEINWEDFLKRYQTLRKLPDPNNIIESMALTAKRKSEETLSPVKRKCSGSWFRLQLPIKKNKSAETSANASVVHRNSSNNESDQTVATKKSLSNQKTDALQIRIEADAIKNMKHSATKNSSQSNKKTDAFENHIEADAINNTKHSVATIDASVNDRIENNAINDTKHSVSAIDASEDDTVETPKIIIKKTKKKNFAPVNKYRLVYRPKESHVVSKKASRTSSEKRRVKLNVYNKDKVESLATKISHRQGTTHHISVKAKSDKTLNVVHSISKINENNKGETVKDGTFLAAKSNKTSATIKHVSLISKSKIKIDGSISKNNENNKDETIKNVTIQAGNSNKTSGSIHHVPSTSNSKKLLSIDSSYISQSNENEKDETVNNRILQVVEANKTCATIHHVHLIAKPKESLSEINSISKINENQDEINKNETAGTVQATDLNKICAITKKLPEILISNTPVCFPFEPYQLQRDYMSKVIECLNNSTHGVLESPTGTGKTLSLLCSTLGWITMKKAEKRNEEENTAIVESNTHSFGSMDKMESTPTEAIPKVIYASRTHSQLEQALKELKSTSYNGMKATIVGSREQLCIHPDVMKESNSATKIHICKSHISKGKCSLYANVASAKNKPEIREATILDIEDLVTAGRKHEFCPYYMSKQMLNKSDIVFMPYNYLIDPTVRNSNKVKLNKSIVILDEAHNVEKICEDSVSSQMLLSDIATCIHDITQCINASSGESRSDSASTPDFIIEDLNILKQDLHNLEKFLGAIEVTSNEGVTFPGSFIFELLESANLGSLNYVAKRKIIAKVISYNKQISYRNAFSRHGAELQKLLDLMSIVFAESTDKQDIARCFKVHVVIQQTINSFINRTDKVVNFWCFSPNFGIQQLLAEDIRCIILTSGTLAPLKPLIMELGLPVSVRLQNPHIITSSQLYVKVVSHGPDKEPLLSTFKNRDNPKYLSSLGRTILSLCSVIPNGLLVFFTSYAMLNKCRESWQASGTWGQIQRMKAIFVEPQTKDAFDETMKAFYQKINDPTLKGAIFLAILRGKVSEGLDFADNNGRGIMITGLPFSPLKDPRVILKKNYLDENRTKQNEMLSGDEWYFLEAMRAINQAIGRVIRHKNDYGAILLCDQRFNERRQRSHLSSWIQRSLKTPQHTSFGPLITEVSRFFKNAERSISHVVND